jgi:hypothetical protein
MAGAGAFSYPIIFLPFISSASVPTHTMPGLVRAFAENQPVTSIVNTIRDLLAQQPVSTDIWIALAWCLGILIVAYALAMALPPQDRLRMCLLRPVIHRCRCEKGVYARRQDVSPFPSRPEPKGPAVTSAR